MNFNQFIQYRALNMKASIEGNCVNSANNTPMVDKMLAESPEFKTVCAPISIPLFDRMEQMLVLLQCSKRTFIEAAIINALDQSDRIVARVNVFESNDREVTE